MIDSFIHTFIHLFIHSFIHSFIHTFIHSFIIIYPTLTLKKSRNSVASINPNSKLGKSDFNLSKLSTRSLEHPSTHSCREICAGLERDPNLYNKTRILTSSNGSIPRCSHNVEIPVKMIEYNKIQHDTIRGKHVSLHQEECNIHSTEYNIVFNCPSLVCLIILW